MYEPSEKAKKVCTAIELSEKASRFLDDDPPMATLLSKLKEAKLYRDGVRVIAQILSERQLVWWGCLAVEHLTPPSPGPERNALGAAVHWVADPNDETRQNAATVGKPLTVRSAAGAMALAACWSENAASITRRIVPSTILLVASRGSVGNRRERETDVFTLGLDVLSNQLVWQ